MKKILVYPYYDNPYQYLLYSEIQKDPDITITYLRSTKYDGYLLMLVLPYMIFRNRLLGFRIFHIHWVSFSPQSENNIIKTLAWIYALFIILFIKLLGFQLIWTIHDLTPHTALTIHDMSVTRFLCRMCTAKIVLSKTTITELKKFHCNITHIYLIPHGNYISYYPNIVSRIRARSHLGLNKKDFIFLFFGQLKVYKGIGDLLEVFSHMVIRRKNCVLVVAGKVNETPLIDTIQVYKSMLKKNLKLYLRHIEDNEVQYFMNAADVVVYPCKRITNSGSVLLGLSFGKPVIFPTIGSLQDLPEEVGFPYVSPDRDGLSHAMQKALSLDPKRITILGENAYHYVESLSWTTIAQETILVYNNI